MRFLHKAKGYGLRPNNPSASPDAEFLFQERCFETEPRSQLKFNLIKRDMLQMGQNKQIISDPRIKSIFTQALKAFTFDRPVKPIHLCDIFVKNLDCRTSSPGTPWQPTYKTRGEVMDDPIAQRSIRSFASSIKRGLSVKPPDCKVLYRAHLQKDGEDKIRAVYEYSTTITLLEAQFALPLIKGYQNNSTPIAYKYDMAIGGAWKLRSEISGFSHYTCLDFSKFDKTVSKQLIQMAFDILMYNIDFCNYEGYGTPNAGKMMRLWNYIVDYFINTPLRLANGERWIKSAGVPSGSYFTQLIESIVNWIVIQYCIQGRYGQRPEFVRVFGDDSIIASTFKINVFSLSEDVSNIGMEVNANKSLVTTNIDKVEFLGFNIANGFPHKPNHLTPGCHSRSGQIHRGQDLPSVVVSSAQSSSTLSSPVTRSDK